MNLSALILLETLNSVNVFVERKSVINFFYLFAFLCSYRKGSMMRVVPIVSLGS